MLTATNFCEDAGTGTFAFEPLQSAFKGFIFTNANFHLFPPSLRRFLLSREDAVSYYMQGKTISQERNLRKKCALTAFFRVSPRFPILFHSPRGCDTMNQRFAPRKG